MSSSTMESTARHTRRDVFWRRGFSACRQNEKRAIYTSDRGLQSDEKVILFLFFLLVNEPGYSEGKYLKFTNGKAQHVWDVTNNQRKK